MYPTSLEPTGYDLHNAAQKLDRPNFFPDINESESHPAARQSKRSFDERELRPAKKMVALFKISLLAQQTGFFAKAFILPLHLFVWTRHQIIVLMLLNPFVQRRNSSVYLVAISRLLHSKHCSKETETKPGQDHKPTPINSIYAIELMVAEEGLEPPTRGL